MAAQRAFGHAVTTCGKRTVRGEHHHIGVAAQKFVGVKTQKCLEHADFAVCYLKRVARITKCAQEFPFVDVRQGRGFGRLGGCLH